VSAVVQRLGISKEAQFRGGDEYETKRWQGDAARGSNALLAALVASSSRIGLPLNLLLDGPQIIRVASIQTAVAHLYGIPAFEMISDRRGREVARPRQIAMYLARNLTRHSLASIGRMFGGRDHTTVAHACSVIARLVETNMELAADIEALKTILTPCRQRLDETMLEAA
jgi:chromosomal replication initiator protein